MTVSGAAAPTWLGVIRQTAFVVDDIDVAALQWASLHGVGPWFLYEVDIPSVNFRGTSVPMRARMGLAHTGSQQIELIQPDLTIPSIYREFLEAGGTGVHHICYWADVDRSREHFRSAGADVVQEGVTSAGNQFLYMSGSCGVPYLEFVDPTGGMKAFFDAVESAAQGWDGVDHLAMR